VLLIIPWENDSSAIKVEESLDHRYEGFNYFRFCFCVALICYFGELGFDINLCFLVCAVLPWLLS
jgi:hypothetical protein